MTKTELRKEFLAKRRNLSDEEAVRLSSRIAANFIRSFDLSPVRYLHVYLPLLRQREIDTFLLIRRIQALYPQADILVPKVEPASLTLESYPLPDDHKLIVSPWGIPEPEGGIPADPSVIDLIILPLLAFDHRGYRVGYGKGFYDRYLSRCRPGALKIGLSYFGPVDATDDTDPFDVPLDFCVTPEGLWSFNGL